MTLSTLVTRPCTIVRRLESVNTDDYGNEIPDTEEASTSCELQQIARTEPEMEGELSDTRWLAIFPAGTDLQTNDAVIVDTLKYELEGDPWMVRNPRTGSDSHVEATLCRTAGAEDG